MNILSLFDGISCTQIACNRIKLKYDKYLASETDKYASKIAQHHYPKTIQLGDVCQVEASTLPKIDLLIGGSPCQGFSIAGKQLNFKDPRSKLIVEYFRLLKECEPTWFLLENVRMKQEYADCISEELNVEPILINSSLVSAQNRPRLYWTNIPVKLPKNKNIYLRDIIETGAVNQDKAYCIDSNYYKNGSFKKLIAGKDRRANLSLRRLLVLDTPDQLGYIKKNSRCNRIYSVYGKTIAISAMGGGWGMKTGLYKIDNNKKYIIRKLSPREAERAQTIPDDYTKVDGISKTQRYRCIGNAFTVDVIAHILKGIK